MKKILILLLLVPCLAYCSTDNECTINTNSNLTLFVLNYTNNDIVSGLDCRTSIWYSNNSLITLNNNMTELSNGFYTYGITGNETAYQDKYRVLYNCTYGTSYSYQYDSYEIVEASLYETIDLINTTVVNNNNYLSEINTTSWNNTGLITSLINYVTNTTSALYYNVWSYFNRTLSEGVIISESDKNDIATKTWNSTIVGTKSVDESPEDVYVVNKYGQLVKQDVQTGSSRYNRYGDIT